MTKSIMEKYSLEELHHIVKRCEDELLNNPQRLQTEGIGRIPASSSAIESLASSIHSNPSCDLSKEDTFTLIDTIKRAWAHVDLDAPYALNGLNFVLKKDIQLSESQQLKRVQNLSTELENNDQFLQLDIFHSLMHLSTRIMKHETSNKMTAENCASIVWMQLVNKIFPGEDIEQLMEAQKHAKDYKILVTNLKSGAFDHSFEKTFHTAIGNSNIKKDFEKSVLLGEPPFKTEKTKKNIFHRLYDSKKRSKRGSDTSTSEDSELSLDEKNRPSIKKTKG